MPDALIAAFSDVPDLHEHFARGLRARAAGERYPRGQVRCDCCEGSGAHGRDKCRRCRGLGHVKDGSSDPWCEESEAPRPRRRHWRESERTASGADYRQPHGAPGDDDYGDRLHEVGTRPGGGIYPPDALEHPQDYGAMHSETIDKVHRASGKPDHKVWVYRSMPSPHREVNTGDWVATAAEYARDHGRESRAADDWPVIKFQARADQLSSVGDMEEWGYHGPPVKRGLVHFRGGANQQGGVPRGRTDALCHEHEPEDMRGAYARMTNERIRRRGDEREAQGLPRYRTRSQGALEEPRRESVAHMLSHYRPYDFDTWDEVRHNINWHVPEMRAFTDDIRRNGVQRPIPVDYEQDPPQVRNGHTRLLAAERAGVADVPVRQHEGLMDPDDPDPWGRQESGPLLKGREAARRTAAIRMVHPDEYSKYVYPDYKQRTLPALAERFRKHPYYQVLKDDIQQNGIQQPMLVRTRDGGGRPLKRPRAMDGHHRAAVAYELGMHMPVGDYDDPGDFEAGREHGRQWFSEHWQDKETEKPPWQRHSGLQGALRYFHVTSPDRREGISHRGLVPLEELDPDLDESSKGGDSARTWFHGLHEPPVHAGRDTWELTHPGEHDLEEDSNYENGAANPFYSAGRVPPQHLRLVHEGSRAPDWDPFEETWDEYQDARRPQEPHYPETDEYWNPPHLYHGTSERLRPGQLAEPGHAPNFGGGQSLDTRHQHAYATPHVRDAWEYARNAVVHRGGEPHVYEVSRAHDMYPDPESNHAYGGPELIRQPGWRSRTGFPVVRELGGGEIRPQALAMTQRARPVVTRPSPRLSSRADDHPPFSPQRRDLGKVLPSVDGESRFEGGRFPVTAAGVKRNAIRYTAALELPHPRSAEDLRAHLLGAHRLEPAELDSHEHWDLHNDEHSGGWEHPEHQHERFYHGTSLEHPGDSDYGDAPERIYPAGSSHLYPGEHSGEHAFATTSPRAAWGYAEDAYSSGRGSQPRVLHVRPTGPFEEDPNYTSHGVLRSVGEGSVRSRHPWAVTGEEPIPEHLHMEGSQRHEAVRDEDGSRFPMMLYRGEGSHDRPSHYPKGSNDSGGWWTSNPDSAHRYARGEKGSVYQVEVERHEVEPRGAPGNYFIKDPAVRARRSLIAEASSPLHEAAGRDDHVMKMFAAGRGPGRTAAEYFHGSDRDEPFSRFDFSKGSLRHEEAESVPGFHEEGGTPQRWWNSRLGSHFTSEHHVATGIATTMGGQGNVYHVDLRQDNPKHYESEHHLARAGATWARRNGYEVNAGYEQDGQGWRYADALQEHPRSQEIADGFRRHLESQGHDGITYRNEYEEPHGHLCAIAFHPDQAKITETHGGYEPCRHDSGDMQHEAAGVSHWQHRDCGVYAKALTEADPSLRIGAVAGPHSDPAEGHALHWFAHNDTHAYDSRGRHPLPYISVWDSAYRDYFPPEAHEGMGFRQVLDVPHEHFGELGDEERRMLPAARRHIRENRILSTPHEGAVTRSGPPAAGHEDHSSATVWLSGDLGGRPRCSGCGHRVTHPDTGEEPRQTRELGPAAWAVEHVNRGRARRHEGAAGPLRNPYHGNQEFGGNPEFSHTWFHGTRGQAPEFGERRGHGDTDRTKIPAQERDMRGHGWPQPNQMMGIHFSPLHEVAHKFASGLSNNGASIVHARLDMHNPAHFPTERHLNYAVAHWASQHYPHWHNQKMNDNLSWNYSDQEGTHRDFSHVPDSPYGDKAQDVLQWHPHLPEIIHGFHQHLNDQGHHGITYGNMVEGPYATDATRGGEASTRYIRATEHQHGHPHSVSAIAQPQDVHVTHVEHIAPWKAEPGEHETSWEDASRHDEPYAMRDKVLDFHRRNGSRMPGRAEGAVSRPGMRNPYTGGHEWYHGTRAHKDDLAKGFADPASVAPGAYSMPQDESEDSGHWNRLLGTHFTADHGVASEFARGEHNSSGNEGYGDFDEREENQGVVHAHLNIRNPKHYASEHDMDHEAYEHEHAAGNHPVHHLQDYEDDEDYPADEQREESWPNAMRIHHDYGTSHIPASAYGHMHSPFEGHPMRTAWLNTHPDKFDIAMRFKKRLQDQGHDGVTYRNEYEKTNRGQHSNTSAIAFHPHQVSITQHHHADEHPEHDQLRREGAWAPSSGIFGPTTGLDPLLFDDHARLRQGVRDALLDRVEHVLQLSGLQQPVRVYLAGGSASEWAGSRPNEKGARDLDIIIGIEHPLHGRAGDGAIDGRGDPDAEAKAVNIALRAHFNDESWQPVFGGTWSLTGYVNPHAWDITAIHPYAAWDLTRSRWAVRPPHLPEHSVADFDPAVIRHARAMATEARAILQLPEPFRRQQARDLWDRIHVARSRAFSDEGAGWQDPGNLAEKWLAYSPRNILGRIRELAHG